MASSELEGIIEMLRAQPLTGQMDIQAMRSQMDGSFDILPPIEGATYEPVDADCVACEWSAIGGATPLRHVLYLHGGGYVIGSPMSHRNLTGQLAHQANARVLSVDYRLAPEHPFPAALDDAVAAYRWLLSQGAEPGHTAIAGDSAGGGLTLATLVALRDAGDPLPAAGVCLSPWVDLEGIGESMQSKAAVDPMVQRDDVLMMAEAYLGGQDPRTPLAAPLYAELAGLPPLLVQVGTDETLLDDTTRFEQKARSAGVDITVEAWEGMIHVWQAFTPLVPEATDAIARIGEFLRKHAA